MIKKLILRKRGQPSFIMAPGAPLKQRWSAEITSEHGESELCFSVDPKAEIFGALLYLAVALNRSDLWEWSEDTENNCFNVTV